MDVKQIKVSRGPIKQVVWTDDCPLLKKGNSIRFKGEEKFWDIDEVYPKVTQKEEVNRNWHVGGL